MKDFKLTTGSVSLLVVELNKLIASTNKAYRVSVVEWRERRSLSQNSMYWAWLSEINRQNPLKVDGYEKNGAELWHEVFKKFWCPSKSITDGVTSLGVQSTTLLDTGEMTFYLNRIESWCMSRGIVLTIPETSEYYRLMESQLS